MGLTNSIARLRAEPGGCTFASRFDGELRHADAHRPLARVNGQQGLGVQSWPSHWEALSLRCKGTHRSHVAAAGDSSIEEPGHSRVSSPLPEAGAPACPQFSRSQASPGLPPSTLTGFC